MARGLSRVRLEEPLREPVAVGGLDRNLDAAVGDRTLLTLEAGRRAVPERVVDDAELAGADDLLELQIDQINARL